MRVAALAAVALGAPVPSSKPALAAPLLRFDGRLLIPRMPEPQQKTCEQLRSVDRLVTELEEVLTFGEARLALPLPLNPKELRDEAENMARCCEALEQLRTEREGPRRSPGGATTR